MYTNKKKTKREVQDLIQKRFPNIVITSEYEQANEPVDLQCIKCNYKWRTTARAVAASRCGCPKCGVENAAIQRAINICKQRCETNGFEYLEYMGRKSNDKKSPFLFKVKCKKCGYIRITNSDNIKRFGCNNCAVRRVAKEHALTTEEFVEKARNIFGNLYDYSKTKYEQNKKKVIVICPKHGEFKIQPTKHIHRQQGCPICAGSGLEKITNYVLQELNIPFEKQVFVTDEIHRFFVDFVLNINNEKIFIETNGSQHYKSIPHWGGEAQLVHQKQRDQNLEEYCEKNHIKLFWIKYDEIIRDKVIDITNKLTAAPDTKDQGEKSTKNGEDWNVDPVVTEETKESSAPYSVETEPEKSE